MTNRSKPAERSELLLLAGLREPQVRVKDPTHYIVIIIAKDASLPANPELR